MINTNALKTNQVYKNYKELCSIINEPIKTGKSKQLQLKDWNRYFSYEKDGQKFIITEIFDTPQEKIDKRTNGNRSKYVQPFMDYMMSTFNKNYIGEYFTISKWTTSILPLLDKEMCNSVYKEDEEILKYYGDLGITDMKLYRNYISTVKSTTRNLILKTFGWLEKRGYIKYNAGYKFYYQGEKHDNAVCTNEVNSLIDDIEREICEYINAESFKNDNIKGKQLIHILQHSNRKDLLELYMDMRMKALNSSDDICSAVNDAIWEKDINSCDFVDGENRCLLSVYKAFRITDFDDTYPKIDSKQEVIEIIQNISIKHIIDISYERYGGYHPYDNQESLDEIKRINSILFRGYNVTNCNLEKINELDGFSDDELDDTCEFDCAS